MLNTKHFMEFNDRTKLSGWLVDIRKLWLVAFGGGLCALADPMLEPAYLLDGKMPFNLPWKHYLNPFKWLEFLYGLLEMVYDISMHFLTISLYFSFWMALYFSMIGMVFAISLGVPLLIDMYLIALADTVIILLSSSLGTLVGGLAVFVIVEMANIILDNNIYAYFIPPFVLLVDCLRVLKVFPRAVMNFVCSPIDTLFTIWREVMVDYHNNAFQILSAVCFGAFVGVGLATLGFWGLSSVSVLEGAVLTVVGTWVFAPCIWDIKSEMKTLFPARVRTFYHLFSLEAPAWTLPHQSAECLEAATKVRSRDHFHYAKPIDPAVVVPDLEQQDDEANNDCSPPLSL